MRETSSAAAFSVNVETKIDSGATPRRPTRFTTRSTMARRFAAGRVLRDERRLPPSPRNNRRDGPPSPRVGLQVPEGAVRRPRLGSARRGVVVRVVRLPLRRRKPRLAEDGLQCALGNDFRPVLRHDGRPVRRRVYPLHVSASARLAGEAIMLKDRLDFPSGHRHHE